MSPLVLALGGLAIVLATAAAVALAAAAYPRGVAPRPARILAVAAATVAGMPLLGGVAWLATLLVAAVPPAFQAAYLAFGAAALPEEAFKGLVVWLVAFRTRAPRRALEGAFLGLVAGAAFGLVEGLGFLAAGYLLGLGDEVALLRLLVVPLHPACGAIVGYHLARGGGWPVAIRGWLIAAAVHGTYDWILLTR